MYYIPQRARTASSGACSHCIGKKQRCYIGVRGIPCSSCRRLNIPCNGKASQENFTAEAPAPRLTYCAEGLFASQIQKTEHKMQLRAFENPAVPTTNPLDNYISIIHQMLGPDQGRGPIQIDLPYYISDLPDRLDAGDLEYLESKGALCLPTARFRTELLNSYILWVHPQVPILDLEELLISIADNNGVNQISLVLFHAVMFAASAFVDIAHIRDEGYPTREFAREVLFQRAKVLFQLEGEDDRLSLLQAGLLMVHWQDLPGGEKDASHWIGICLSLAGSIGLHCSPDGIAMTPSRRRAWKRTWWCVYNHARLTSKDLLTMMSIVDEPSENGYDSNGVSMITMSDFKFGVFPPTAQAVAGGCEVLRNVEYQKTHALIFIEKINLCRTMQFSVLSNEITDLIRGSDGPDCRLYSASKTSFGGLEQLKRWSSRLPTSVRHQYPLKLTLSQWEKSIYLHRTWLRLFSLGLSYMAHREQSHLMEDTIMDTSGLDGHYDITIQVVLNISNIFEEVHSLGLSSSLPHPAVVLLLLVLAFHQRAVDTGTPSAQMSSSLKLHHSWNILNEIRERSDIARNITEMLAENPATDIWERLSSALLPP